MRISYIDSCTFPVGKFRAQVDVPSMSDHNGHTNWLKGHEDRLKAHDDSIKGVTDTVLKHADRILWVEQQINKMPQATKESLVEVINSEFAEKWEWLTNQVRIMREERAKIEVALASVQNLQFQLQCQLETLKNFFEKSNAKIEKKD